jgi:hypothetical protein
VGERRSVAVRRLAVRRLAGARSASGCAASGCSATGCAASCCSASGCAASVCAASGCSASCCAASGCVGAAPAEPSSITASSAPTSTVSSSATVILLSTPATGDGISVSTLSVETSRSGSSTATWSPSFFSQRVTVPSVTLSPRRGIVTETDMRAMAPSVEGASCLESGRASCARGVACRQEPCAPRRSLRSAWGVGGAAGQPRSAAPPSCR